MSEFLPAVGSFALMEALTAFVPDDLINERWPVPRRPGRRFHFSAAQLWRVHLLSALTGGQSFNAVQRALTEQRSLRCFAHLSHRHRVPDIRMLHQFRIRLGVSGARWINDQLSSRVLEMARLREKTVGLIDATDLPARTHRKKDLGSSTKTRAAVGVRTRKPGQTRFFVGYKKHTLRLWISGFEPFILLAPIVSWAAPANIADVCFLWPSLQYCRKRLGWSPDIITGDMAYIDHSTQRALRQQWQLAVVTKLKAHMKAGGKYSEHQPRCCHQGQPLKWLGYDPQDQHHWFAPAEPQSVCGCCWERGCCPGQFAVAADTHETFFGMIPLNTAPARRLNHWARSWIEPAQSFEKNQLGLKRMFLNSLRLCWIVCLLADSVVLLRVLALLSKPPAKHMLAELLPTQFQLTLD